MDQQRLMELLTEASKPECDSRRRNSIQVELGQASAAAGKDGVIEVEGKVAGIHLVLETLYVQTILNRPELLPTLFPAFAVICGDRDENLVVADTNWSLVPS